MQNIRLPFLFLIALLFAHNYGFAFEKLKTDFAFMPSTQLQQFAQEVSGEAAKRNLDTIALYHRTRGSEQFRQSSEFILSQLKAYGYQDVEIMAFPANGKTMFGTQKSRFAWKVKGAELWETALSANLSN
jgi:aminopeptidase YwaD